MLWPIAACNREARFVANLIAGFKQEKSKSLTARAMVNCAIPGCTLNSSSSKITDDRLKNIKKVSFLGFPLKNPALLAKWVDFIRSFDGLHNWQPSKGSKICGLHFNADLMENFGRGKTPSSDFIPTIKNPTLKPLGKSRKRKSTSPPESSKPKQPKLEHKIDESTSHVRILNGAPPITAGCYLAVIDGIAYYISIHQLTFEGAEITSTGQRKKVAKTFNHSQSFEVDRGIVDGIVTPDGVKSQNEGKDDGYTISISSNYSISINERSTEGDCKKDKSTTEMKVLSYHDKDLKDKILDSSDPISLLAFIPSSIGPSQNIVADKITSETIESTSGDCEESKADIVSCSSLKDTALPQLKLDENELPESQHLNNVDYLDLDYTEPMMDLGDPLICSQILSSDEQAPSSDSYGFTSSRLSLSPSSKTIYEPPHDVPPLFHELQSLDNGSSQNEGTLRRILDLYLRSGYNYLSQIFSSLTNCHATFLTPCV
ncbi:Hypothetical predicted protein [Cloeon dipterum]|uniref:THAP-type domain-containing protein n=1 Tax=Cloeon dipterum TaxID=197152 RepID=A0A8S1C783_9INSE|nr:Hypothetical predicted protein [Cloeon dipterum]